MEGKYNHEWEIDLNWWFKPTQRDMDDPKRMEIVRKVWRDTDVLKYHILNGDPLAVKKHSGISRFINLSERGMEYLKIDKKYVRILLPRV